MIFRILCFLWIISGCFSCDSLSSNKETAHGDVNATIDFKSVDTSPSFENCKDLLDQEKTDCFRNTMQQNFENALSELSFEADEVIDEEVLVVLHIDKQGDIRISDMETSTLIQTYLPDLKSELEDVVSTMPRLFPATKRGIPVATAYTLPIKIVSE